MTTCPEVRRLRAGLSELAVPDGRHTRVELAPHQLGHCPGEEGIELDRTQEGDAVFRKSTGCVCCDESIRARKTPGVSDLNPICILLHG